MPHVDPASPDGAPMAPPDPSMDRARWLLELRRENERQEAALAPVYDERWGEIEGMHRAWVQRFCSRLPPAGRVLDAACGTGKYFAMVLEGGRSLLGVDHTQAYVDAARRKHPDVPTERHDLQELPYREAFDGVMCVDAMEFVPPEEWPGVLERFRRALRPGGWLYLTVELGREAEVRAATDEARAAGLPVLEGEAIWHDPEPYYHFYPSMGRVRSWLGEAGFEVVDELEGPWQDDGYAYHHVLARASTS